MTGDGKVAGWTQVNGELTDSLPLSDRGLAYGDGLFETLRVVSGRMPLLARHLLRLARGCEALSLPCDPALIEAELVDAAERLGEGVLKLTLTRGSGPR
ncbi:MAG: aminotransferase class IV, partial [Pseudomonadota bacterium]|nr:aminotransferase class IV [Pseudomonadota bacterium]